VDLTFKFYGKSPDPDRRKIFSGEPINLKEFRHSELTTFAQAYRNEISNTVRRARKWFSNGIYCTITPQQGAFDHLQDMLKNSRYELTSITRASYDKDVALFRVQVQTTVEPAMFKHIFHEKLIHPDMIGKVSISFYIGVCPEFVSLQKPDELNDTLRAAIDAAKQTPTPDPAFQPENVLPVFLKDNRLEARHNYLYGNSSFASKKFYQSPEGYIYRIEIDGYSALEPVKAGD
jgi:hypothetical protein